MLYRTGRFFQFVGLFVLLPAGMAGNVYDPNRYTVSWMMEMLAAGGGIFVFGWFLQQMGRAK